MTTTDQDLRALTYLARRLRDETHGCRQWDEAGTFANLKDALAGQNLLISVQRVIGHAVDPEAMTPGAIKRPFIPELAKSAPTRDTFDPAKVCAVCSKTEANCAAPRFADDDHRFVSIAHKRPGVPPPDAVREAVVKPARESIRAAATTTTEET